MKKIFSIILISIFTSCASYKPIVPSQTDAERASQKYPGTTLADLTEGKSIFEHSCKKCHSLGKPFNNSAETVEAVLPKMAKRAKLDTKQEALVLKYLLTMHSNK